MNLMERRIKKTFLHTSILFLYKKIIFLKENCVVFFSMTAAEFGLPVYTHPTTSGNKHIPSGGSSGQILRWSADGTAAWGADNNTTYSDATTSAHGLMTAADKTKLNGIATSAGKYTLVATWQTSGDKTITGCTVGQLILFLYSMGKSNYNPQETDTGCWIRVVSGAVAGSSASGGHFWLGTTSDIERRSTNIFATVATATSVKVNLVDLGDDATPDTMYVYR